MASEIKSKKDESSSSVPPIKKRIEESLSEVLDADWGISNRRNAINGFVELLSEISSANGSLTTTTRDYSLVLDAILKTKNSSILKEIIQTIKGLESLRMILILNRDNSVRIPIIRKVFTILDYLADKKILTPELVNIGSAGKESLRETILGLTEHSAVHVHQVARKFRNERLCKAFAMKSTHMAAKQGESRKRKSGWDEAEEPLEEGEVSKAQCSYLERKSWNEARRLHPRYFVPWGYEAKNVVVV